MMTDEDIQLSQINETMKEDISANNLSPADLHELKSKLSDELKILETARTTAELRENTSNITELQESISELKKKLLVESNDISLKEIIIKRLEMHELLCTILFKETKDARDVKITTNCLEELPLVSEIMRIQKDVETLQETYNNHKRDNLKIKQENMALMAQLKDHTDKVQSITAKVAQNKDYRLLKSELDVRSKSLDILKNIISRMVIGAGDSNPHLQDLILECGEPSNIS